MGCPLIFPARMQWPDPVPTLPSAGEGSPQIDRFSDGKLIGSICCFSAFLLLSKDLTSRRDRLEADSGGSPGLQWDTAYVADLSNVTHSNTRPMAPSTAGPGSPLPSAVPRPPHPPAPNTYDPHTFMRGAPSSSTPMLGSWESRQSNGSWTSQRWEAAATRMQQHGFANQHASSPGAWAHWLLEKTSLGFTAMSSLHCILSQINQGLTLQQSSQTVCSRDG